mmetsp:Transcript_1537/g.2471  ORF Transcript_1537/g.2471 Transcript_1537/m.2471 type:complete len:404 (-) Transcript_1537:74-1285(-)
MKSFHLHFLITLLLWIHTVTSISSDHTNTKTSSNEFNTLIEIAELSKNSSIISLTETLFTKYITKRPRLYYAVLYFTAKGARYDCSACISGGQVIETVANYYHQQYDILTAPNHSKIAFFDIDVSNAEKVFQTLGLQTVPRTFIVPPKDANSKREGIQKLELESGIVHAGVASFLDALRERTGVEVKVTMDPKPFLYFLCGGSVILAFLVDQAVRDLSKAVLWYRSPALWLLICLLCFCVGVSGSIYCIIRSSPLVGPGPMGTGRIFSPEGRGQFLLEGVFIAALTIAAAGLLAFAHYATKAPIWLVRHVSVLVFLSGFIVCAVLIFDAYVTKTGWYRLQDTLPPEMWIWMSSSVKRNSGILKRLYRLTEYILRDSKGVEDVLKKAKLLIVDYAKRTYFPEWK